MASVGGEGRRGRGRERERERERERAHTCTSLMCPDWLILTATW